MPLSAFSFGLFRPGVADEAGGWIRVLPFRCGGRFKVGSGISWLSQIAHERVPKSPRFRNALAHSSVSQRQRVLAQSGSARRLDYRNYSLKNEEKGKSDFVSGR